MLMIGPPGAGKSMLAAAPARPAAAAGRARGAGSLHGADRWPANCASGAISRRAPVPHAASFRLDGGAGRRRAEGEAGRSQSLRIWACCFSTSCRNSSAAVLDSLRQPIETGEAVVARANAHVRYPARFQLVAAMNPCRCGYLARSGAGLRARAQMRARLPGADFRAAARPHRHPCRGGRRVGRRT